MDLEGLKYWGLSILVLVSVCVSKDPLYHGQIFKYCFKNVSYGYFLSKLSAELNSLFWKLGETFGTSSCYLKFFVVIPKKLENF